MTRYHNFIALYYGSNLRFSLQPDDVYTVHIQPKHVAGLHTDTVVFRLSLSSSPSSLYVLCVNLLLTPGPSVGLASPSTCSAPCTHHLTRLVSHFCGCLYRPDGPQIPWKLRSVLCDIFYVGVSDGAYCEASFGSNLGLIRTFGG